MTEAPAQQPLPPIVVMGVSGSGKSTVGAMLADRLHAIFVDGDSLHPLANREKMRAGHPLNDEDRAPWLAAISERLGEAVEYNEPIVLACSALKHSYRDLIRASAPTTLFVYLHGDRETIEKRLDIRHHEFMPTTLLDSQFDTLEPPTPDEASIRVDIRDSADAVVDAIVEQLGQPVDAT